ncbi:MAG: hypothetical protein O9342_16985 [Beijerinckiaceae bacterium]|nr:hypothetical protein [Beijerinckiaceae bacterium]
MKKRNSEEKRALQSEQLNVFIKKYARKKQPGHDPNDRSYDPRVEQKIRRIKPEILDSLLRNGDES